MVCSKRQGIIKADICARSFIYLGTILRTAALWAQTKRDEISSPISGSEGDVLPPALVQVNVCVIATCLGACSHGNIDFSLMPGAEQQPCHSCKESWQKAKVAVAFLGFQSSAPDSGKKRELHQRSACSRAARSCFEGGRSEGWHTNLLLHLTGSHRSEPAMELCRGSLQICMTCLEPYLKLSRACFIPLFLYCMLSEVTRHEAIFQCLFLGSRCLREGRGEAKKGWKGRTGTERLPSYPIRCGGFAFSSMKGFLEERLPTQSWIWTAAQPQAFCSEATHVMALTYLAPGRQTVIPSWLDAGD